MAGEGNLAKNEVQLDTLELWASRDQHGLLAVCFL